MNFTHKARYVVGGNLTEPLDNVPTYASTVSRESVRILFLIAALYDIKVFVTDIVNAFINYKCAEEVCFKAGPEFKSHKGMWVIIVRAIYGLKISGALFRAHLDNTLQTMGFKPTFGERDVWMHKKCLPLPQELNNYTGRGTGTDTNELQPALNPISTSS